MSFYKAAALVLLQCLVGCGKAPIVPPEVLPFVQEFEAQTGVSVDVEWSFEPLPPPFVGTCGGGKIKLDPTSWEKASPEQREVLVWHELGHCALGLGHGGPLFSDGCPPLMWPQRPVEWCAKKHLQEMKQSIGGRR